MKKSTVVELILGMHITKADTYNFLKQVAQNQVKVATDGSFCADTTFVQTPLKSFLFTLRLRSRYLKGTPELALYASKKIGTIRCTDRIILKEK